MPSSLDVKIKQVGDLIQSLKPVVVAYSGGVDSTLVAKLATIEIGPQALIVLSDSPSLPRREFDQAVTLAKRHSFNLHIIHTKEMEVEEYKSNPLNRCYFCKTELYKELTPFLAQGYRTLLDGANLDDLGDIRPGRKAAREKGVRSLLVEAGINKREVREAANKLGLENWNKPAAACLSSRFPYHSTITPGKLAGVEKAEDFLLSLGIEQVRVRHHDKVARIEVPAPDFELVLRHRQSISQVFKELGYAYTSLDLLGFRSGSLNTPLPSS